MKNFTRHVSEKGEYCIIGKNLNIIKITFYLALPIDYWHFRDKIKLTQLWLSFYLPYADPGNLHSVSCRY